MHVLIVGAGIGGLALAQCLRKKGISFEIFERDANADARFQGWAIAMHTIVDELLASMPDDMPELRTSVNHLAPLDIPAQFAYYYGGVDARYGFEDSNEVPFIRAERLKLRKWLLTNLEVKWGAQVTGIEQNESKAWVFFKDGTSAEGDIVVGADGVYSPVRQHLLQRPAHDLLQVVPLTAIVGELDLYGEDFRRQLVLGHSAYNLINPELGFIGFVGLHYTHEGGNGGRFYWMFMQPDPEDVSHPQHWIHTSTQAEKLEHVRATVSGLSPRYQEIFQLTQPEHVRKDPHVWRDLELASLPGGRIALVGDAAHAMTPSRGEGAFHAFIDAMKLSKVLVQLDKNNAIQSSVNVEEAVADYHEEMLKRGSAAVRASRSSYADAKKRAESKTHFTDGMKPLPALPLEAALVEAKM